MATEKCIIKAIEWNIKAYDTAGKLLHEEQSGNMVVRLGRKDVLRHIINVGSPINTGFIYLGAGSSNTAAAVTDTTLGTELTGNADRIDVTDSAGNPLDDTDIVQETSGSFDQKVVLRGEYDFADGNNGSTFAEYGLFSSDTFAMGTMFNRFVPAASIAKNASIKIVIEITLRA